MALRTMLVAILFSHLQTDNESLYIVSCRLYLVAGIRVSKDVELWEAENFHRLLSRWLCGLLKSNSCNCRHDKGYEWSCYHWYKSQCILETKYFKQIMSLLGTNQWSHWNSRIDFFPPCGFKWPNFKLGGWCNCRIALIQTNLICWLCASFYNWNLSLPTKNEAP